MPLLPNLTNWGVKAEGEKTIIPQANHLLPPSPTSDLWDPHVRLIFNLSLFTCASPPLRHPKPSRNPTPPRHHMPPSHASLSRYSPSPPAFCARLLAAAVARPPIVQCRRGRVGVAFPFFKKKRSQGARNDESLEGQKCPKPKSLTPLSCLFDGNGTQGMEKYKWWHRRDELILNGT